MIPCRVIVIDVIQLANLSLLDRIRLLFFSETHARIDSEADNRFSFCRRNNEVQYCYGNERDLMNLASYANRFGRLLKSRLSWSMFALRNKSRMSIVDTVLSKSRRRTLEEALLLSILSYLLVSSTFFVVSTRQTLLFRSLELKRR